MAKGNGLRVLGNGVRPAALAAPTERCSSATVCTLPRFPGACPPESDRRAPHLLKEHSERKNGEKNFGTAQMATERAEPPDVGRHGTISVHFGFI
jgi:hypothetical protein